MTAPPPEVRLQTSDFRPEGLPGRAPYLVAGAVLAALFAWQSGLLLIREPAHPRASWMDDDYPLEPGLVWVYKGGMGLQVVRRVWEFPVLFSDAPEPQFFSMGRDMGPTWFKMLFELPLLGQNSLYMRRTHEGVLAKREDREQLIMKFPMRPGDSWTIDFPTEDLAECTVLEPEQITVLKQQVSASKLRVVRTNRKNGKKVTDFEWYVRGIGLARMEVTFGIKAVFELERFEHAK